MSEAGRALFLDNLVPRVEFLAQALVVRERACPHCGSREFATVARKHLVVRIRRCERCALCFTDPIYRSRLGDLYDSLYAGQGSTTELPGPERLAELKRSVFAGTDKDFRRRIARLRAVAPGPRLLELGSSWGYFLYQAAAAGFDATGVEIGARRAEFGRSRLGVRIVSSLDALASERFDLVYTSHVLEHFTDLSGVLPRLAERLVPGGRLVLEVPHFDYPAAGSDALSIVGAVHPLGFSTEFVASALPAAGLRVIGFFDGYEAFPERPLPRAAGPNLVCLAERA